MTRYLDALRDREVSRRGGTIIEEVSRGRYLITDDYGRRWIAVGDGYQVGQRVICLDDVIVGLLDMTTTAKIYNV